MLLTKLQRDGVGAWCHHTMHSFCISCITFLCFCCMHPFIHSVCVHHHFSVHPLSLSLSVLVFFVLLLFCSFVVMHLVAMQLHR